MATTVHLSTNSSEIIVVSNLNKTYSSEGVPTLKVASKIEFPLQSHKVQEAKMADQELLKIVYFSVSVQWFFPFHNVGMRYLTCDSFDTWCAVFCEWAGREKAQKSAIYAPRT